MAAEVINIIPPRHEVNEGREVLFAAVGWFVGSGEHSVADAGLGVQHEGR